MSPETAQLKELQEKRTEVQHELDRVREEQQRLRRSREEIAEQIERLEEEAKAKAEARKFIPGEKEERAPVESLEDELKEEKEQLAGVYEREDELEEEKARLDEEIDEVAGELLGEAVRDEAEALKDLIAALKSLGLAVPEPYQDLIEARREYQELHRERREIQAAASPTSEQERELSRFLKSTARGLDPAPLLGFVLVKALDWTRRGSGLQKWWSEEHQIEPLQGSVLQDTPLLPESNETWNLMKHGRLPITEE